MYVLERIKNGYQAILPNICEEILAKSGPTDKEKTADYTKVRERRPLSCTNAAALSHDSGSCLSRLPFSTHPPPPIPQTPVNSPHLQCHLFLASLSQYGALVRSWMHKGCFRVEPYGAMEHVLPCPSHVICSGVLDNAGNSFCDAPLTDFVENKKKEDGATGAGAKK